MNPMNPDRKYVLSRRTSPPSVLRLVDLIPIMQGAFFPFSTLLKCLCKISMLTPPSIEEKGPDIPFL